MDAVSRLLADLVAIPSMNPMGRGRTGIEYSEQAIAEFIAAYLRRESVDVELQQVEPGRPNVIARIDVGAPKTLLLEAHLDTVVADGMDIEPFTPVIRDDKLYGRGACDTKGSIAAFLYGTLRALRGIQGRRTNILLLFVSDEEYRFTGASYAVRNGLKADFGIAGEPTQLRIVRAHKGVTRWKVITKGVAAHSAYPERGKNAIYAMAKVIDRLEHYASTLATRSDHPVLGRASLSVGVIEGGEAVNVVPDRCCIEVDRRTLPGETPDSVLEPIRSLLSNISECEIQNPHISVSGMDVAEQSPAVLELAQAIKTVCGDVRIEGAQYATDAGIYTAAGIPTVVFGPGDIALAHTKAESIEISQLHQAVSIIERLLTS